MPSLAAEIVPALLTPPSSVRPTSKKMPSRARDNAVIVPVLVRPPVRVRRETWMPWTVAADTVPLLVMPPSSTIPVSLMPELWAMIVPPLLRFPVTIPATTEDAWRARVDGAAVGDVAREIREV